jgi:spermidine synthase
MQLLLASLAFFVSGAAALVYQVTWQRLLALPSGIGIYSVAMIVASFMAGLGLGSHIGGRLSARVSPKTALGIFASLELAIGVLGVLSPSVFYDLLYVRGAWLYGVPWRAGLVHFASLLLPTLLMGMSLPFLVRGMVRSASSAARTIGLLYGINTLGAAVGAAATPWLLIRFWGIPGATFAAALANGAAGLLALALTATARRPSDAADEALTPRESAVDHGRLGLWIALYALSGFIALSLEILWFRIVEVAAKSTPFTFGTVLALYLAGYGAGSLLGAPVARRVAHPLRIFCLLQCAMLIVSGLAVGLLAVLPPELPLLRWYIDYWRTTAGFNLGAQWDWALVARIYLVIPGLLYGVPTLLMGFSFPILQRAVQDDPATSGRKVGLLQAANIAGCVAGSLLVGLLALDVWGTMGTLRGLLALGLIFAVVGWRAGGDRRFLLAGVALACLAVMSPSGQRLWACLHGAPPAGARALYAEDATAVVAIVPQVGGRHVLLVGGRGQSWIPFGGVHSRLGAMPVLIHPAPLDVAVVGLGSGDTAWAASCRSETRSVAVFEIARPELSLLARFAGLDGSEGRSTLGQFLGDPRVNVRYADGRAALMHEAKLYDVIETDAMKPNWSMSGTVHSQEYFALCARRLKPGGLMCTWIPTLRTLKGFRRAFPYALKLDRDGTYIGSTSPIPLDRAAWAARVARADIVARLSSDLAPSLGRALAELEVAIGRSSARGETNEDLYPRDEFAAPVTPRSRSAVGLD